MKKQNLTEEIYRMRKLMNFDSKEFNENTTSEDSLIEENYINNFINEQEVSEENINESVSLLWTNESANELNNEILNEISSEIDNGELLIEQEEKEISDDEFDDLFIKYLSKYIKKYKMDEENAKGFVGYVLNYIENIDGGSPIEENFVYNPNLIFEQGPGGGATWLYDWLKKGKGRRENFKRKVLKPTGKVIAFPFKVAGKAIGKTIKFLGEKWKNFGEKLRRHFTKQLKKKWVDGKSIDFGYAHSFKIGKYKPSQSKEMISSDKYKVSTPIDKWDEILNSKIAKKMVRKMPKFSKGKWNELINDKEHKGFAVSAVEYFKETNPKFKWKKVLVGRDSTLIIDKIPIEKDVPGEPKKFPTITYDLPQFGNGSQLFEDNEWCINGAPEFKKQMDDLFFGVEEIMSVLNPPEDKPKCAIKSISIESSCSRFRNDVGKKCGGGPYTFEELAKKRLETAKDYIFSKVKQLGIVEDNLKESYKWDGTNGDGSSGPQPPSKFAFIPIGKGVPMSPHCNSGESECDLDYDGKTPANLTEIDGYVEVVRGNVLGSRKDYEEFKYIRGKLELVFNDTTIPEDPEVDPNKEEEFELVEIEGTEYPIIFYTPPKSPFELKLPTLRFNFKKGAKEGDKPNKEHGSTECPAFG
jgi:hypothetical protein